MSTEDKQFKFYSRGRGQTVTIVSPTHHYDQDGKRVEKDGLIADFGILGGRWETDNEEHAALLRERDGFNVDFFEEGNEPDALKPSEPDALASIVSAVAAQDLEALEGILQREKSTHNRPTVVGTAETALADLRKIVDTGTPRTEPEVVGAEVVADPNARPVETTAAEEAAAAATDEPTPEADTPAEEATEDGESTPADDDS